MTTTDQQIPGAWECPQCGFILTTSNLNINSGTITANNEPFNQVCPNDGKLMQPWTYKKALEDMHKSCQQQIKRAAEAEELVAWIRKAIGAPDGERIYGRIHVLNSHAHGYITYIESYRCDDKQGLIAQQEVALREKNEALQRVYDWCTSDEICDIDTDYIKRVLDLKPTIPICKPEDKCDSHPR